jgi:hypothetical protein
MCSITLNAFGGRKGIVRKDSQPLLSYQNPLPPTYPISYFELASKPRRKPTKAGTRPEWLLYSIV